jgi:hypothetical protein
LGTASERDMMTEPINEGQPEVIDQGLGLMNQDQGQEQQLPQQEEVKINPAWNNLLSRVPQGLHGQILPELQQWEKNYTQGMQKVHSQYAGYKPFLDQQIAPEQLNEAYMIRQALEQDPMKFVQALVEHYNLELPTEQGQPNEEVEEENPYDLSSNPEWQNQQQMVQTMAQALLLQNQQAQEAQEDADLDSRFESAKERHGDFDEDFVMKHLYFSGAETVDDDLMDEAIEEWKQHVQSVVQNYRSPSQNAPVIMGGGGGLPSQQTQVGQMTGNQRRALVAQTLANLKAQGGGNG